MDGFHCWRVCHLTVDTGLSSARSRSCSQWSPHSLPSAWSQAFIQAFRKSGGMNEGCSDTESHSQGRVLYVGTQQRCSVDECRPTGRV